MTHGGRWACTVRQEDGSEVSFTLRAGEPVLSAVIRRGGLPVKVGCRGGGCGVCRVQVLSGTYTTGPTSRAHVSDEASAAGFALACRLYPSSDLVLRPARR